MKKDNKCEREQKLKESRWQRELHTERDMYRETERYWKRDRIRQRERNWCRKWERERVRQILYMYKNDIYNLINPVEYNQYRISFCNILRFGRKNNDKWWTKSWLYQSKVLSQIETNGLSANVLYKTTLIITSLAFA